MSESKIRKVGKRGQVTIPKDIREQENIHGGDKVEIVEEKGGVIIRKIDKTEELKEAYRSMGKKSKKISEEMIAASEEALERQ